MNRKTLILLTASLIGSQTWAGNLTIPNTFVDGTTASANQVNSNFNAVKAEVNDNNTRIISNTSSISTNAINIQNNASGISTNTTNIGLNASGILTNASGINANAINIGINAADIATNVTNIQTNATNIQTNTTAISNIGTPRNVNLYVNGIKVGAFLEGGNSVMQANQYSVLLDSRYLATVWDTGDTLIPEGLYFESNNCTGQAYMRADTFSDLVFRQGVIFSNPLTGSNALYYVEAGAAQESLITASYFDNVCVNSGSTSHLVYKANANNPAITGVTLSDFVGDVTLGY